jgi:type II secretory pathway component PulF
MRLFNRVKWKLPIFGRIIKSMEVARFSRTLGTLLSEGVTLTKSLEVLRQIMPSILFKESILQIMSQVEQGMELSSSMESTGVFPLTLVKMIQVGEESGRISELFLDAAVDYEDEVSFAISGLLSVLEPFLILVMGAIVGFIVISLFFPIFTLSTLVK